jgi:phage major head subunit gpT-like protein
MDINTTNMADLFKVFNTAFTEGMQRGLQIPGIVADEVLTLNDIAMIVPSTGASTVHAYLNQLPGFRRWEGDRQKKNISTGKLEVINADWEDTVCVDRNSIADDSYGLYTPLMTNMGVEGSDNCLWLDAMMDALLANGKWSDDKAFFHATRKYGANTIANTVTDALSATTLEAGVTAMRSMLGPENNPLNTIVTTLLVGPSLRSTAFDLVKNTLRATTEGAAIENRTRGLAQLKVHPKLTGTYANYWFLLGQKGSIKAGAVQKRQAPVMTALDKPNDSNVFFQKEFIYGADARGEAFLTLPHLAYRGAAAA